MDAQVDDPVLGTLLDGRYRIRGRVSRGAAATVYTAVDERLGRTVAVTVIHPEAQRGGREFDPGRFLEESWGIARLTHPNALACYGQGVHGGLPYLVTEYTGGRTLHDVLAQRGRLAPVEALIVLEQLLAALAAGHRAGLSHLDVGPETVLVAESPGGGGQLVDAVVKVAEIGLARALAAAGAAPSPTAAYVAPELVADGHADPRSDVYSAGIVLFEMLTGRVPFTGPTPAEVAWQHVEREVPAPSRLVPGLPPLLDDLVATATRRQPGARPTDAGALLVAVQSARETLLAGGGAQRPVSPAAQETMIVNQVVPAQRPSWARLPDSAPAPDTAPRARRRAAAKSAAAGLPAQLKEHYRRLTADPRGRTRLTAGAVALALLVVFGGWWLVSGRYDTTPLLVNLTKDQAVSVLHAAGLEVAFDRPLFREDVPKDVVLTQDPPAGADVSSGGTVTLVLSAGAEVYEVPDVSGKTWELAVIDLQVEPLKFKPVKGGERYDDLIPKGVVLETVPKAGEQAPPGAQIKVILSKGRNPLSVPFVEGRSLQEARSMLEGMGLRVSVEYVDSDKPYDTVVKQDPANGTGTSPGSTVKLQVSKNQAGTVMPQLRGWRCGDAENHLRGMGLDVELRGIRGDDKNAYQVERQFPGEGSQLRPGQRVVLRCER